jgi:hypothetical protein
LAGGQCGWGWGWRLCKGRGGPPPPPPPFSVPPPPPLVPLVAPSSPPLPPPFTHVHRKLPPPLCCLHFALHHPPLRAQCVRLRLCVVYAQRRGPRVAWMISFPSRPLLVAAVVCPTHCSPAEWKWKSTCASLCAESYRLVSGNEVVLRYGCVYYLHAVLLLNPHSPLSLNRKNT